MNIPPNAFACLQENYLLKHQTIAKKYYQSLKLSKKQLQQKSILEKHDDLYFEEPKSIFRDDVFKW